MKTMRELFSDPKFIFFVLASILTGIFILQQLEIFAVLMRLGKALLPLLFSVFLVLIFEPIIVRLPFKRFLSSSIVYFGFLILLSLAVISIFPIFMEQFQNVAARLEAYNIPVQKLMDGTFLATFGIDKNAILNSGYTAAINTTKSLMNSVSFYSVSFIAAYFISLDLEFFAKILKRYLPSYQHWLLFYKTSSKVVYHYLKGMSIDLLFLFISTFAVLFLFGFEHAILYALILALLNLLPYIGPMLGQALVVLVYFLRTGEIPWLLFVVLYVLQQVESNWIQPLIFKRVMNLRPIFTFVMILVGSVLYGVIGAVLAPILAAIVQLAFRSYLFAKTTKTIGTWENIWYNFDDLKSVEETE